MCEAFLKVWLFVMTICSTYKADNDIRLVLNFKIIHCTSYFIL